MYLIVILTVVNIGLAIATYTTTYNKVGETGNKGIQGLKGESGKDGMCNIKCGQKMCYSDTINNLNIYLRKKLNNPRFMIRNKFMLNKINKICHSQNIKTF